MNRDVSIFLKHILEAIKDIEDFTRNKNQENFLSSKLLQEAVIRRLEVIGEATKNIPLDFRNKYYKVKWSNMTKTRDKLIHGYFGIDLNLTWDIVKDDLPDLKKKIKNILEKEAK